MARAFMELPAALFPPIGMKYCGFHHGWAPIIMKIQIGYQRVTNRHRYHSGSQKFSFFPLPAPLPCAHRKIRHTQVNAENQPKIIDLEDDLQKITHGEELCESTQCPKGQIFCNRSS